MDIQVPAITRVDATRADAPKLTSTKSFAPAWKAIAPVAVALVITPFADAASPIYANSGFLPFRDYWRLGTIFGAIFLILFIAIEVPWASLLWGK